MIRFLPKTTAEEEFVPFPDLPQEVKQSGIKFNSNLLFSAIMIGLVVVIALSAVVIVINIRSNQPSEEKSENVLPPTSLDPAATPIALPAGAQSYSFSHGKNVTGPKPTKLVIDPLDPGQGGTQTISLTAQHDSPILGAAIEVISDNAATRQTLKLSEGSNLQGVWSGSWIMPDTYNARYGLKILLQSANGRFDNTMWFRQPAGQEVNP